MVRSIYKNGCQDIFLIVKLSVMEFSKRAMQRKPWKQKTAINLQRQAVQGSLQDLSHYWPMKCQCDWKGPPLSWGKRAIWSPCSFNPETSLNRLSIESKLCKIMHALFNAGYCSLSTEPRFLNPFPFGMRSLET